MCDNCGCLPVDWKHRCKDKDEQGQGHMHKHVHGNEHGHEHEHKHEHEHEHGNEHEHEHTHEHEIKQKIAIDRPVLEGNDYLAKINRQFFNDHGLFVINLISSPGSGKTTIVEYLARHFKQQMAVIVGDIQTHRDAERARAAGCKSVQIETLGACHLDAHSVGHALETLDLQGVKLLVIENVGNLVCPSTYDLGEHEKIAVLSLPEGDDKVLKYPALFFRASTILLNKIDLAPYVKFDKDKVIDECRSLNRSVNVFEIAASSGLGMENFIVYLSGKFKKD
jgi:hydrogenase nickel incorporation protein HypB